MMNMTTKWLLGIALLVIVTGSVFALRTIFNTAQMKATKQMASLASPTMPAQPAEAIRPATPAVPTSRTKPTRPQAIDIMPSPSTSTPHQSVPPTSSASSPRSSAQGNPLMPHGGSHFHGGAAFGLARLFHGIGRLEEDGGKTPITPVQAKAILTLMTPLRTKTTLTTDEAEQIRIKLEATLTSAQRDAIAQSARNRGGFAGGQGGPDGRPGEGPEGDRHGRIDGGEGGPGGMQGAPGAGLKGGWPGHADGQRGPGASIATMIPFNPPADNQRAARMAERNKAIFDTLETKAKP